MKKINYSLIFFLTACLSFGAIDYITEFADDGAVFEFKELTEFEGYAAPRTLVGCVVDFSKSDVLVSELELINTATNKSVAFQLSDIVIDGGKMKRACVNFFTDLPAGGSRRFELRKRSNLIYQTQPSDYVVSSKRIGNFLELNTGVIAIAIPTKKISVPQGVIAPVAYMRSAGKIGSSYIVAEQLEVVDVNVDELEAGRLFTLHEVSYTFSNGGIYRAKIKTIAGYEHIEFEEHIDGLSEKDDVRVEFAWDNFNAKYRFSTDAAWFRKHDGAWRTVDEPLNTSWIEEDPHWSPGWREDPSKEMVMKLLPYSGNGVRELSPYISFWEKGSNARELSIFVLDHLKWQDFEYKVWQHSQKLAITFRYTDGLLYWMLPLQKGTRSTAIALTCPQKGQAEVEKLRNIYLPIEEKGFTGGSRFSAKTMRLRYAQLLHQRYGCLSLDRRKNWVLQYPADAWQPADIFDEGSIKTPDEYEDMLTRSSFTYYPIGLNVWPGINSIQHRFVFGWATDGYSRLHKDFTPEQKKRIDAIWLTAAYITASEELHPIRMALAGCPNMAADGWCVPAQAAFLFPNHPLAAEWLDYYERYWQISSEMFTRPDVEQYQSKGGRWTESLGVYNWAHLRPTGYSQFAGDLKDGKNRWANPAAAMRGRWMVDMLSAPIYNPNPYWRQQYGARRNPPKPLSEDWQQGMPFDKEFGFERQYPAHGAHGTGTGISVPPIVHIYGHYLHRYDPILAENLMWIGFGDRFEGSDDHFDWISLMLEKYPENSGTNPHLKSAKYTGHGIVLRSGVNTPQELSIHLNQVDRGPNYRWGNGGEGASGSIYFYAGGKSFSGHERESAGDRNLDATDGVTTFGVMKDHTFRSIGFNVLEKPMYDLPVAQFAEIVSRSDESKYSYPEYEARTIMLVGSDYWILADQNGTLGRTACRFTWFTAKDHEFPKLIFLEPETIRNDHWTEIRTPMSKGFHRDFTLENTVLSTVLVTHKDEVEMKNMNISEIDCLEMTPLKQYRRGRGFDTPRGAWRVQAPVSNDIVFRSKLDLQYEKQDGVFDGQAGVIRHFDDGVVELAMFKSKRIGSGSFVVEVDNSQVGVSCRINDNNETVGNSYGLEDAALKITADNVKSKALYINGVRADTQLNGNSITATLPAGSNNWQLTSGKPQPQQPTITDTEYTAAGVMVYFESSAAAEDYLVEISTNGGKTWGHKGNTNQTRFLLSGLDKGKYHVRIIPRNGDILGKASYEYPVYSDKTAPLYPEGLKLEIERFGARLTWGSVLGATEYRLYRRKAGDEEFALVYGGKNNEYHDKAVGRLPAHYELPGLELNFDKPQVEVYEYAISAVNGFGEGEKSPMITTAPASWLNWSPATGLRFNRRTAYWDSPYVPERRIPDMYYPED